MSAIQIRPDIPRPQSRLLMARRKAAVPRGIAHATPVFAAAADSARVTDVDGNVFLDFTGSIGMMNVGPFRSGCRRRREEAGPPIRPHLFFGGALRELRLARRAAGVADSRVVSEEALLVNSGAEAMRWPSR